MCFISVTQAWLGFRIGSNGGGGIRNGARRRGEGRGGGYCGGFLGIMLEGGWCVKSFLVER